MVARKVEQRLSSPFAIALAGGGELRTLRGARNYIAVLPKREHDTFAWRAAIQALMLVAEHGGDTMLPRIGIMRALYPGTASTGAAQEAQKKRAKR